MGGRISLGQVRPKRRRGGKQDFIAQGFDEDALSPVSPSAARQTTNESFYLNRGAKHGCQGKKELSSLPEDFPIPGMVEHELEEVLQEGRLQRFR